MTEMSVKYETTSTNGRAQIELCARHKAYSKLLRAIIALCAAWYELRFNEPAPKARDVL